MAEFGYWQFGSNNGLKGVANTTVTMADGRVVTQKDPDNPAILQDKFILEALSHSRQARYDYNKLYPDLDADSQERLDTLLARNPRASRLVSDDTAFFDAVQNKSITSGV